MDFYVEGVIMYYTTHFDMNKHITLKHDIIEITTPGHNNNINFDGEEFVVKGEDDNGETLGDE